MVEIKGTFTKAQYDEIRLKQDCHDEERIGKGFIGIDGQHHSFEYGDDYVWHTNMKTEDYLSKNKPEQLASCQKCPMWEHCRKNEYTVTTQKGVEEKLADELAKEIDKHILERMNEQHAV
jgi:hypothetical protein